MKNIFFKAVPGLFQRKRQVKNDNQSFYYDNKVMSTIKELEKTNYKLVDKVSYLNESTSKVGEKTEELFQIIDNVKYDQAEELEKMVEQLYQFNDHQKKELNEMKDYFKSLQKKQQDKMGRQLGDVRTHLQKLREIQDKNQINLSNDNEILTVLLEGLYKRLDSLQNAQKEEISALALKIAETDKGIQEKSNVHLEYNKSHSDILYKMREQHFEFENNQLEEQRKLASLLTDLKNDMEKLERMIEHSSEGLLKN